MNIERAIETARGWESVVGSDWTWYEPGLRSASRTIAKTAIRYLKPGARVLDYGCGPCNKTAVLADLGFNCTGYDRFVETWHRLPGNMEKIQQFAAQHRITLIDGGMEEVPEREKFDMVMSSDVLEHLPEPRGVMETMVGALKSEGVLMILVPNAGNIRKRLLLLLGGTNYPRYQEFYWTEGRFVGHVREYVRGDLKLMSRYLGLEILELRGVDHMIQKVPRGLRFPYKAITALAPGLKDTWLLVARKYT
jgi:SAM-dependent methyltransferase